MITGCIIIHNCSRSIKYIVLYDLYVQCTLIAHCSAMGRCTVYVVHCKTYKKVHCTSYNKVHYMSYNVDNMTYTTSLTITYETRILTYSVNIHSYYSYKHNIYINILYMFNAHSAF